MRRADAASRALIEKEAKANGLDPDFVEAVFLQEGGTANVYNWDVSHYAHGPMQTSLAAAYDGGYSPTDLVRDPLRNANYSPALASPELSIKYGTRYLAQRGPIVGCSSGDYPCYLAAYNAGNIIGVTAGGYKNQAYVDSVWEKYRAIKGGSLPEQPTPPDPSVMPIRDAFPCTLLDESLKNQTSAESDKATPAYIPRSPYSPYVSIKYTGKEGGSMELAAGSDGRPKWLTYFEFHERLGGLATARARLFDTGGDIIVEAVSGSSTVNQDSVGNPQYDPDVAIRTAASQFNALDNVKLVFGYAPSVEESINDESIFGIIFPGSMGEEERRIDPLAKLVAPRREMYLQNYQPRFLGYGVEIDLVFADASAIAGLESKTRTYTKEETNNKEGKVIASGQQGGGIPTGDNLGIVETICKEHGWQVCSEKTKRLQSYDALDSNTKIDRPVVQSGKDDITFIRETLAPNAESEQSDSSAYNAFLDSSTQPSTLHFHPPNLASPASRSYYYTRSRNGTVLRFEPVVNGQLVALFGGVTSVLAGTDMVSNEPISSTASPGDSNSNTLPGTPLPEETEYQEDGPEGPVKKTVAPKVYRSSADKNTGEQKGAAQSFRQSGSLAALSAQMVVLGDPTIRAGVTIDVSIEVFNPAGSGDALGWDYLVDSTQGILGSIFLNRPEAPKELYSARGLHYTSGKWMVMEVRHVIQGGEYLTYLDLMRNTLQSPGFTSGNAVLDNGTDSLSKSNVSSNLNTR
jgi:hypothetical protein